LFVFVPTTPARRRLTRRHRAFAPRIAVRQKADTATLTAPPHS